MTNKKPHQVLAMDAPFIAICAAALNTVMMSISAGQRGVFYEWAQNGMSQTDIFLAVGLLFLVNLGIIAPILTVVYFAMRLADWMFGV